MRHELSTENFLSDGSNRWGNFNLTDIRTKAVETNSTCVEPDEVQRLLGQLENPFRVMVLLDVTTGLRRSELFA